MEESPRVLTARVPFSVDGWAVHNPLLPTVKPSGSSTVIDPDASTGLMDVNLKVISAALPACCEPSVRRTSTRPPCVGDDVGAAVGDDVGAALGEAVGAALGDDVGVALGEAVGVALGAAVGLLVGATVA
jgi:hypothetical protein